MRGETYIFDPKKVDGGFLVVYPIKDRRTSFEFKFWIGDVPPPFKLSDIITMEVIIAIIALIFIGFLIMQIRKMISMRKD